MAAHKAAPSLRSLRQRALSLGGANAYEYMTQFLLPVVLARSLDVLSFGQYRLLWLAVRTVVAIAPLAVPAGLYYFLPRSDGRHKRLYINQALLFLSFAGLISGWAVSGWNPWLPQSMHALTEHGFIVPAFVALWVIALLLDMLPAIEERVTWQIKATITLATLRTLALSLAAIATGELRAVLIVLLGFVGLKLVVLVAYLARYHGLRGPLFQRRAFSEQVRHAAPFGAAGALYDLRAQADQWVAASLFSIGLFASFSVAAVIGTLLSLFRRSVNTVFMPSMSRLQATGDLAGMIELNSRANAMVGALACPIAAFAFVFAEDVVTVVYTAAYLEAADVMRVYILGLVALVVELASITLLMQRGKFVMGINIVALVLAVPISWFGALHFGLPGAAAGSVTLIYLDRIATLRYISRATGIPFRRLQDWPRLGMLILCAALSAALAAWAAHRFLGTSIPLVRLAIGALITGLCYVTLIRAPLASGIHWLTGRNAGHEA
ncbi:MAG TPA: oligosaccharide flippase family protein [Burkholderiales bacterium]|nr:oligosaccharide flippase family protein [Burkholderiales bacterium]